MCKYTYLCAKYYLYNKLFSMPENKTDWKPPKNVAESHQKTLKEIGAKLEKLRKDVPASQFAKDLGISRNSYRQMEQGQIYFSMENFLKILNHYHISMKDFFTTDIENL